MGVLDSIERGLEKAVNTAFAKTFRSGVQPVEISSALKRELDVQAVIVDRDRILVPNSFYVKVSKNDFERLSRMQDTLEEELRGVVEKHASQQGYQFAGTADVQLIENSKLSTGVLEILSESVKGVAGWLAALKINGEIHALQNGITVIGRDSNADVRLTDNGASRRHLEIIWNGKKAIARDLGSTNGSKVNGQRFGEAELTPNTVITIGETKLIFTLIPKRQNGSQTSHLKSTRNEL